MVTSFTYAAWTVVCSSPAKHGILLFGTPIPGATIVVKGTNTGTVTDEQGTFGINAPSNAVLDRTDQGA